MSAISFLRVKESTLTVNFFLCVRCKNKNFYLDRSYSTINDSLGIFTIEKHFDLALDVN